MSLEVLLKDLTEAIKENTEVTKSVNDILGVYPNAIDEAVKLHGLDKEKRDIQVDIPKETVQASVTVEAVAKLATQALKKDKSLRVKIKSKLDELGVEKVTETPEDKLDELHEFLKGLI